MTNQMGFMCSRGLPQISKKAWAPPANHCTLIPLPQWPQSTAKKQVSCWWVSLPMINWPVKVKQLTKIKSIARNSQGCTETNLFQVLLVTCILIQGYSTMKCTWLPLKLFLCPAWLIFLFGCNLQRCELQSSTDLHYPVLAEYKNMPYSQLCFCMIIYYTMTSQANIILPHACLSGWLWQSLTDLLGLLCCLFHLSLVKE